MESNYPLQDREFCETLLRYGPHLPKLGIRLSIGYHGTPTPRVFVVIDDLAFVCLTPSEAKVVADALIKSTEKLEEPKDER